MQTRAFNSISVDEKNYIFTKSSHNIEKLKNEILYYLQLPKELLSLFPKLINYHKDYSAYMLEYIPYNSLEEFILNKSLPLAKGKKIIYELTHILERLHTIKPPFSVASSDVANFYIIKTQDRINELSKNPIFTPILSEPYLKINGILYKNFCVLEQEFSNLIQKCAKKYHYICTIHGDFCFSNILYSPSKNIIKLIDPRGSFTHKGIYGHDLYDYAKLLHCLHSRYDFLVNDRFKLHEFSPHCFYFDVPPSPVVDELEELYVNILIEKGINLEFIYLIEASLFLSMACLHYENSERQKVLYLTGITILNQVIEGKYAHMH